MLEYEGTRDRRENRGKQYRGGAAVIASSNGLLGQMPTGHRETIAQILSKRYDVLTEVQCLEIRAPHAKPALEPAIAWDPGPVYLE